MTPRKALVIEDDAGVRANVVELLTEEGFDAVGAEDGERGVDLAREIRPALIVCDVNMPKLDGYQVVSLVRADPKMRATPFIFLSGASDRQSIRAGMNLGADDYLTKPFSRVDLLQAVRSRLERQRTASPPVIGMDRGRVEVKNLPPLVLGKYKPLRKIALGGMGAVYEVEHVNTGERLALKVMLEGALVTPGMLRRFQREARAAAAIKSEHIVRIIDADVAPELDGAHFLVMELLDGQNFEQIAEVGRVKPAQVVECLRPIARTLDKAHRLGIVHRDLKPENLFLARREEGPPIVKLLDFGVAKIVEEAGAETVTGQVIGTPGYMAPEQASDASVVSAASDRFSLGLIAFRLLVGAPYYADDNVVRVLLAAEKGPDAAPSARGSDFGGAFDDWFAKACAKEPSARFETASEQVEELASALGLPTQPLPRPENAPVVVVRPEEASSVSSDSLARMDTVDVMPRRAAPGGRWLPWVAIAALGIVGALLALRGCW